MPAQLNSNKIRWGLTHRGSDGRLVVRHVVVAPPEPIACVRLSCLWRYTLKSLRYVLLLLYHQRRIALAEAQKDCFVPEHYRSGSPAPRGIPQAIREILKLEVRRLINGANTKHHQ